MIRLKNFLSALLLCFLVFSAHYSYAQPIRDALSSFQALESGDLILADFYATLALESPDLLGADRAAVYSYRGDARRRMGRFEEAILDYNLAIEMGLPTLFLAKVYNNRGIAHFGMFFWDMAARDYRNALILDPGFVVAMDNLGTALMAMGQMKEAIQEFTKAISLDPMNPFVKNNRGRAYLELRFYEESIRDFTDAIAINSFSRATPLFNRGIAHEGLGNFKEAKADFERVFELRPDEKTYMEKFYEYRLIDN